MNKRLIVLGLIASGLFSVHSQSALETSKTVLEKWVEARRTIGTVRSSWAVEKEILQQSLDAYGRELKTLGDQRNQVDEGSTQTERELILVETEKEELTAASDALKTSVGMLETRVRGMSDGFPPPVVEKIEPLFDRIPENPDETKLSLSARFQNIVGILNELDKFNGSFSVVSELRRTEGGVDVQARVLYIGLGQAYFMDQTGDFCGYGVSSPSGWTWIVENDLGPVIKRAIGVYENSQPAAFVSLPVRVK